MQGITLSKSLIILSKCYVGIDDSGNSILDPSIINDELSFNVALKRLEAAIANEELKIEDIESIRYIHERQ